MIDRVLNTPLLVLSRLLQNIEEKRNIVFKWYNETQLKWLMKHNWSGLTRHLILIPGQVSNFCLNLRVAKYPLDSHSEEFYKGMFHTISNNL